MILVQKKSKGNSPFWFCKVGFCIQTKYNLSSRAEVAALIPQCCKVADGQVRMRRKGAHLLSTELKLSDYIDDPCASPPSPPSNKTRGETDSKRIGIDQSKCSETESLLYKEHIVGSKVGVKTKAVARLLQLAGSSKTKDARFNQKRWNIIVSSFSAIFIVTSFGLYIYGKTSLSIVLVVILLSYVLYNEYIRMAQLKQKHDLVSVKLRNLMERRRAAGLRRLESETAARRLLWSAPPASSTVAYLRRSHSHMPVPAAVDYRLLAIESFNLINSQIDTRKKEGNFSESRDTENWIIRQLLQSGVRPTIDAELFTLLHTTLDKIESGISRKEKYNGGFHCRVCLTQLYTNASMGARLQCKHEICRNCTTTLVENALEGNRIWLNLF